MIGLKELNMIYAALAFGCFVFGYVKGYCKGCKDEEDFRAKLMAEGRIIEVKQ